MYFRRKTSAGRAYLQIVESHRDGDQVRQQVIATLGRFEELQASGQLERLVRSGARFAAKPWCLSAASDDTAIKIAVRRIGPALVFERLWEETGCRAVITEWRANASTVLRLSAPCSSRYPTQIEKPHQRNANSPRLFRADAQSLLPDGAAFSVPVVSIHYCLPTLRTSSAIRFISLKLPTCSIRKWNRITSKWPSANWRRSRASASTDWMLEAVSKGLSD